MIPRVGTGFRIRSCSEKGRADVRLESFWDSEHSIYVNARHKDVHYREIAEQIAAFVPAPAARVLDYGSGDAVHADLVAAVARAK